MRFTKILAGVCLATLIAAPSAWSQDDAPQRGPRGERPERGNRGDRGDRGMRGQQAQRMTPERAEAVWQWQARELAAAMKLESGPSQLLTKNFVASRKKLEAAMAEARQNRRTRDDDGADDDDGDMGDRPQPGARRGGGGGGAMREMMEQERDLLGATFATFLTPEQAKQATKTLGTSNRQWDGMVDRIVEFKLGDEKTMGALAPIRTFMTKLADARESGDRQAMREIMGDARETMEKDLAAVLTEEQLAQLQPQRRGGFGGSPRPDGPRDRGTQESIAKAVVGKPAPAFKLADASGKMFSLADYRGKIVVLQWINPDCPVCQRVSTSGQVASMMKQARQFSSDVVHLTVNSTHYMEPAVGAAYLATHKIVAPVLVDRDGTLGHLYGAKTTPHMFVIDAQGVLRYDGAIDDDPAGRKGAEAVNYVVQAVRQIAAGETVSPDSTKSYGCSVKYATK